MDADRSESGRTWFQVRGSVVWHVIDPAPKQRWPREVTFCGLGLRPGEHVVVGYSGGRDCQNCAKAEAKRAGEEAPPATGDTSTHPVETVILWKSTIVIWSPFDASKVELSTLAEEAESGLAICTQFDPVRIDDPASEPDFPAEFFGTEGETTT